MKHLDFENILFDLEHLSGRMKHDHFTKILSRHYLLNIKALFTKQNQCRNCGLPELGN